MKYGSIVVGVSVNTSEGLSLVRNCKCGLHSQSRSISLQRPDEAT